MIEKSSPQATVPKPPNSETSNPVLREKRATLPQSGKLRCRGSVTHYTTSVAIVTIKMNKKHGEGRRERVQRNRKELRPRETKRCQSGLKTPGS